MNIFDNISSLILFKHQFTLMIVNSSVFELQAHFHHQMLLRVCMWGFFLVSRHKVK